MMNETVLVFVSAWPNRGGGAMKEGFLLFVLLQQFQSTTSVTRDLFSNPRHALTLILSVGGEEPRQIYACLGVAP